MKFYIASSSKFIEDCATLSTELEANNHQITRKWWNWYIKGRPEYKDKSAKEYYQEPLVQFINRIDLKAVDDAEIVVAITKNNYKLTGGMIELGYALAKNKIIFIVGDMKKSTMVSSFIHVLNIKELLDIIKRIT